VPKPEGVFDIEHPFSKIIVPGFVMEYIPGIRLSRVNETLATSSWLNEIRKVRSLGYYMVDWGDNNALWVPEIKKIYLIDFESWGLPKNN